jgi:hypothetical protein
MPATVAESLGSWPNWAGWPVPTMPDLPLEPWAGVAGSFWRDPIVDRPVDTERTGALVDVDVPISAGAGAPPYDGATWGMPYQLVDSTTPTTPVWDASRPITWRWFTPTFPIANVPLPALVRREADPAGSVPSDLHWYGYDPAGRVLWEAIALAKPPFARWTTWGRCDWTAGYSGGGPGVVRWDTSRPWNAPGQPAGGIVAVGIPQLPLIARWDEVRSGRIRHALFGTLPNYAPGRTGPARASDGTAYGHPVRAGERLRLRRSAVERFTPGTTARIVAEGLHEFGWIQGDRNAADPVAPRSGSGAFFLSQDRRWHTGDDLAGPLGEFRVRLSDFDAVT